MSLEAKATVLIADDDLTLRDMYKARLEADGFQVLVAADGEEALKVISDQKPDLILLDIMMPKVNGLDVLADMKKDINLKKIPVIILTALIQDLTKIKSLMTGADDYLMKSEVMPGEVIEKVKGVLQKSKSGAASPDAQPQAPAQTQAPTQPQAQTPAQPQTPQTPQ